MSIKKLIQENLVLTVGITLPILLMILFVISTLLPSFTPPPQYSAVFYVDDYRRAPFPFIVDFTVDDGTLYANYRPAYDKHNNLVWKKLYLYDARTQQVQSLNFTIPTNLKDDEKPHKIIVESTKMMKLNTAYPAPDGYTLDNGRHMYSGLIGSLIDNNRPRGAYLRKDNTQILLSPTPVEFIGWVIP